MYYKKVKSERLVRRASWRVEVADPMNLRPPATSVMSFPANSGAVMTYLVQTTVHFRGRLAGDEPALCNPVEELGGYDVCGRLENQDRPRDMVELSVQQSPQRAHRSLPNSSRFHIKEVVHCRVLITCVLENIHGQCTDEPKPSSAASARTATQF